MGDNAIGYVGNNGTLDSDYQGSLATRTQAPGSTGAFRGGASYGGTYADFDQDYAPINSYEQGSSGGSYTVRAGDSLASVAAQLWGEDHRDRHRPEPRPQHQGGDAEPGFG